MKAKAKILFGSEDTGSFIDRDYNLLKKHFFVKYLRLNVSPANPLKGLLIFIKLFFYLLWSDITFSWFAGFQAYILVRLSKIFRKKSIVIIGGYELAKIPEINYGALMNPALEKRIGYIFKTASVVLTVDEGLKTEAMDRFHLNGNNIITVPTGFDSETIRPGNLKENLVLTVAIAETVQTVRLKGLDTFVKSASYLPDIKFLVIGAKKDVLKDLKRIAPPNVEFIDYFVDDIIPYYQRARVYCQLSMREGHPNALCEAMLCECVPVGCDVQGIKNVIGSTGYLVPYGDIHETAKAIKSAMVNGNGKKARDRIVENYSMERREKSIISIIDSII